MMILDKPAPGRSCGTCTLCCKVHGIAELAKPVGKWCPHCEIGKSCKIYETRPQECRTFHCLWLADGRMAEHWRPDRSKIVVTPGSNANSLELRCDPGHPGAWRKEPYYSEIKQLAMKARSMDGMLIVAVNGSCTFVAPEGEFFLGDVHPDQRIVQQFQGTRLVNVRLVHKDEVEHPK
jgi:hypothetical protein